MAFVPAFAKDLALLPASTDDQVPARLVAAKKVPMPADLERAPVGFSWALDPAHELAAPAPYVAESREYWTDVDGESLAKGLALRTGVAGAVVRISPALGAAAPAIGVDDVAIRQGKRTLAGREAIADADVADEFKSLGMPMPERTFAFRLDTEVEPGAFELLRTEGTGPVPRARVRARLDRSARDDDGPQHGSRRR